MNTKSTVDAQEIAKFSQHADVWWDKKGPLKTLHDINPVRLEFMENNASLAQKRVLDVGCGGGILSEGMAIKKALVTGLDVEENALTAARKHAISNKLTIDYVCSPIEDYVADSFDIVTCMEMLEHVKEPQIVIDHCARLLKPGGYLFLSTINRTLKAYAVAIIGAEYLLSLLPRQTHDYEKFIKPSELTAMARKSGLELRSMAGMAYNPLDRTAKLTDSVDVNYLVSFIKPFSYPHSVAGSVDEHI